MFAHRLQLAAFVLGLGFLVIRTTPASPGQFPVLPPIAGADPSIRHKVVLCLPDKLRVTRTDTTLSIGFDMTSLQKVPVTAGKNMVMGIEDDLRVYAVGTPRPASPSNILLSSGWHFCTPEQRARSGKSTAILNRNEGGIPETGKKYIVEMETTVFETDIPSQHRWQPQGSPKYRKLWSGTLKSSIEADT